MQSTAACERRFMRDLPVVCLVHAHEVLGVYLLQQRLSGFPAWSPRVHRRVAVRAVHAPRAIVYDWLPVAPRDASTLLALVAQRPVMAQLRARPVRWPLKYASAQHLGDTRCSLLDVDAFNRTWREQPFHLVRNNCARYTDALCEFMLCELQS